ncbi:hypothetical protein QVD17_15426 [Tagetes erecta]|uniref:Uncharacterized protein n=1 Tax=Tagetes erecta TaxID=13708 RepID=A0AAD8KUW6_TARER|nr:hypothetical protein QVD17_15426 [Tagetes erecta]
MSKNPSFFSFSKNSLLFLSHIVFFLTGLFFFLTGLFFFRLRFIYCSLVSFCPKFYIQTVSDHQLSFATTIT